MTGRFNSNPRTSGSNLAKVPNANMLVTTAQMECIVADGFRFYVEAIESTFGLPFFPATFALKKASWTSCSIPVKSDLPVCFSCLAIRVKTRDQKPWFPK
jgi:hypothetical protein